MRSPFIVIGPEYRDAYIIPLTSASGLLHSPGMSYLLTIVLALANLGPASLERLVTLPPEPGSAGTRAATVFHFVDRGEAEPFELLNDRGEIDPSALHALSHFVRCRRTGRQRPIAPRLAKIVLAAAQYFLLTDGDPQVDVISGTRARPFGAPHSNHFVGHAMDIAIPGVSAKLLSAWIWKNFRGVGVGYYPNQSFVHVDVREVDVRWIDRSHHGEGAHARYFARSPSELMPEIATARIARRPLASSDF